jgi:hypothetical protein
MARKQKRTKEVDNLRPYLEGVAKNLADKLYGPQGPAWGTKLSQIEDLCLDIREVLSVCPIRRFAAVQLRIMGYANPAISQ